jgi:hypothetical protein
MSTIPWWSSDAIGQTHCAHGVDQHKDHQFTEATLGVCVSSSCSLIKPIRDLFVESSLLKVLETPLVASATWVGYCKAAAGAVAVAVRGCASRIGVFVSRSIFYFLGLFYT